MARAVLGKAAESAVTIFLVLFVSFLMLRHVGDPAQVLLGELGSAEGNRILRERSGLDDSAPTQFLRFLQRAAQGDLGNSYRSGVPVAGLLAERLPASFELVCCASALTALLAIPLGVFSAAHRESRWGNAVQMVSLAGASIPTFLTGVLLIFAAAVSVPLLPASGRGEIREFGWWSTGLLTSSGLRALVLPSLTIALYQWALFQRLIRSEMIEVLRSGYIVSARARGLGNWSILVRHGLRNAMIPVLTVAATQFGALMAGSIATETVFEWPGLGSLFIHALRNADYPVISGYLLFASALFMAIHLVVDAVCLAADPRLRRPAGGGRER